MQAVARRRRASWLLAMAAACLLAQSTVWPVVAPSMAMLSPTHEHITMGGAVPDHVHSYEEDGHSPGELACRAASVDADEDGARAPSVVCAPSSDGATTSVTTALHGPAFDVPGLTGATMSTAVAVVVMPSNAALSALAPPPRS